MDQPSGDPKEGDGVDCKDHSQGRLEGAPPGSVLSFNPGLSSAGYWWPKSRYIDTRQTACLENPGAGGGTQLNQTHSSAQMIHAAGAQKRSLRGSD